MPFSLAPDHRSSSLPHRSIYNKSTTPSEPQTLRIRSSNSFSPHTAQGTLGDRIQPAAMTNHLSSPNEPIPSIEDESPVCTGDNSYFGMRPLLQTTLPNLFDIGHAIFNPHTRENSQYSSTKNQSQEEHQEDIIEYDENGRVRKRIRRMSSAPSTPRCSSRHATPPFRIEPWSSFHDCGPRTPVPMNGHSEVFVVTLQRKFTCLEADVKFLNREKVFYRKERAYYRGLLGDNPAKIEKIEVRPKSPRLSEPFFCNYGDCNYKSIWFYEIGIHREHVHGWIQSVDPSS